MIAVTVQPVVFDIGGGPEINPGLGVTERWESRLGPGACRAPRRGGMAMRSEPNRPTNTVWCFASIRCASARAAPVLSASVAFSGGGIDCAYIGVHATYGGHRSSE